MESIFKKNSLMFEVNNLYNKLKEFKRIVNKLNVDYNVNEMNNNLLKMLKISVKSDNFNVNEDKQRQCYKQLKCFWPKCRYSCDRESILNNHISHHLNKRQFVCEECDKQFHHNSDLIQHKRWVHSTDRPFVCNRMDCNKTFKTYSHLTQHNSTHSSVKSFGCNKCDKRFKTNLYLSEHKKFVHSNFHPFVCPQNNCKKRFKRRKDLNRHKSVHSSDKPFECEECNQRFKKQSYLMLHKSVHSNVKQFECNVNNCNKIFKQKSGLSNHKMRSHSGLKRHKCFHNNCDQTFITSTELKLHIAYKHSTKRPFECNFQKCNSSFKTPQHLNRHKKTVHFKNN